MPGPALLTTIVNVAFWPAWTVPLSGVFATETSGQLTTTEADAVARRRRSLVVTCASVLLTVPQSAASVTPWM